MFKYLSDTNINNVLKNGSLRFTQPSFFNDPFETQVHTKGLEDRQKAENSLKKNSETLINKELDNLNLPPVFEKIVRQNINMKQGSELLKSIISHPDFKQASKIEFNKTINENIGILSLTTNNKNLLMWAHYANSHKGICIEFDKSHKFFNQKKSEKDSLRHLAQVQYQNERPSLYLSEYNEFDVFLTKSNHWEYEEEYRMLMPLKDADQKINNGFEDIYLFNFPKDSLKTIYLGTKISNENKDKIINLIQNEKDYNHVEIFETKISDEIYDLEFTKLDIRQTI